VSSDPDNVGSRMTDIFEPPSPAGVPVDPELPRETADRIRALIRSGDLEAAAELGRAALEELGVDPPPAGQDAPSGP
jgi:hypothetical protein